MNHLITEIVTLENHPGVLSLIIYNTQNNDYTTKPSTSSPGETSGMC